MAINKRLIAGAPTGGGGACTTNTLQILGDSSCIAYYKMADATDESGSFNGTPTSVDFNVEGKYGLAGEFNGSSSIINLGDHNVFSPSVNALSVSCWIKTTSTIDFIFSKGGSGAYEYGLFIDGSGQIGLQAYTLSASSSVSINTSSAYNDGNWHHVVGVYDPSGNFKIYVDGSQQATSSTSLSMGNSSNALILGKKYDTSSDFFNGSLDQIRIFNKAVSALEVGTLYAEVQCPSAVTPSEHFNTVIWNGSSGTKSITVGFQPDFTWIKNRTPGGTGYSHQLYDSVRGATKAIFTNDTDQQYTRAQGLTSFDSSGTGGFTVGSRADTNSGTMVSWNWYAPTSETNNAGTNGATSQSIIKKNVDAGFSIVKYTGNETDQHKVYHGLGAIPQVIILKCTGAINPWYVYHQSVDESSPADFNLRLNETDARQDSSTEFSDTPPTANLFTLGTTTGTNKNNTNYIAYVFAQKEGYSRFGSYVGTDAPNNVIVTNFEPAFLMIKSTGSTNGEWIIFDNKRNTTNPRHDVLKANSSGAETTEAALDIDFTTNGFILNGATGAGGRGNINTSNVTFIFMAFAQAPDSTPATEADSFEAKTYTGDGNSSRSITGVGFKPDFSWIKKRGTSTGNHLLQNTVNGAGTGKALASNETSSAGSYDQYGYISAFGSDGFTLQAGTSGSYPNDNANEGGSTYVAWNWKAADHDRSLATINQDGSITSIVSANQAAGFSIVKTKSPSSTINFNYGHGLSKAPELVMVKTLNIASYWEVIFPDTFGSATGSSSPSDWNRIKLNELDAVMSSNAYLAADGTKIYNGAWQANTELINYCFHSVSGYQKVGSYTWTGTSYTAGTLVTGLGFTPRFVIIKNTTVGGDWQLYDNQRVSGTQSYALYADLADAEGTTGQQGILFDSDGFSAGTGADGNSTASSSINKNGSTYIYLAIA